MGEVGQFCLAHNCLSKQLEQIVYCASFDIFEHYCRALLLQTTPNNKRNKYFDNKLRKTTFNNITTTTTATTNNNNNNNNNRQDVAPIDTQTTRKHDGGQRTRQSIGEILRTPQQQQQLNTRQTRSRVQERKSSTTITNSMPTNKLIDSRPPAPNRSVQQPHQTTETEIITTTTTTTAAAATREDDKEEGLPNKHILWRQLLLLPPSAQSDNNNYYLIEQQQNQLVHIIESSIENLLARSLLLMARQDPQDDHDGAYSDELC